VVAVGDGGRRWRSATAVGDGGAGERARWLRQTVAVHAWLVGGAIIEGPEGILLVHNRRDGGRHDWSPPGGVIDDDEELLAGLTREVSEETGLAVTEWRGPLYEIETVAPDLGWHLRVEVHYARAYEGELRVDDPDGIVDEVAFVALPDCPARLRHAHPWVVEPLTAFLDERWEQTRRFDYHVAGVDLGSLKVTRR
jgi:ADP-ribose pyrophosphatase YjhB (NUDIX family)